MSQSTECLGSVVPLAVSYHVSLFITFGDVVYNDIIITGAEHEEPESGGDMLSEKIQFVQSVVHFKGTTTIVFFLGSDGKNS